MKATMSLWEGQIRVQHLLKNWAVSWAGNFVGSLAMLGLVLATGIFHAGSPAPVKLALAKTSFTFLQVGSPLLTALGLKLPAS
jgi:formate/nitrite transporter FocA (FNT family)